LKNNNDVELLNLVNEGSVFFLGVRETELPLINYASMGGGGNPSDSGGFNRSPTGSPSPSSGSNPGSSNSGGPSPSPSGGSNPGSSNSGGSNPDNVPIFTPEEFNNLKRATTEKLRRVFVSRPRYAHIRMTDPQYENQFNALDHNIICKHFLDINSFYLKDIHISEQGHIIYRGIISQSFLHDMDKPN
jgi:hypothetical protein